jgi:hypothetical protein
MLTDLAEALVIVALVMLFRSAASVFTVAKNPLSAVQKVYAIFSLIAVTCNVSIARITRLVPVNRRLMDPCYHLN